MKNILLTVFVFLSLKASAQTSINPGQFSKIKVSSGAKVILKYDSSYSVEYSGNENIAKDIKVSGNTLNIDRTANDQITVHTPQLTEVILEGEGLVRSESLLKTDQLHLQIQGGGKIEMNVDAQLINADISGLGKIVLKGNSQEANFSIPGSGKIDAEDLKVIKANVTISGLGKCVVDATDVLNANISGNGTIVYKKLPKELNKTVTGLGSVKSISGSSTSSNSESDSDNSSSNSSNTDTTKVNLGKNELWFIGDKEVKFHSKKTTRPIWAGFEYGLNTYMDNGGTFTLDKGKENFEVNVNKSEYVSLNFLQEQTELGHSNIWLMSGLGITWNNYRFDNDIIMQNGEYTTAYHDTSDIDHIKSKLVTVYLTAPVMFEVFTSRRMKDAFHIGVGGMFGLRIDSYTKRKFDSNDESTKVHAHEDYNLNPFRYGFRVALGYGRFNVFADYYASTMFKENKGPVLFPVSAGITVIGF